MIVKERRGRKGLRERVGRVRERKMRESEEEEEILLEGQKDTNMVSK